jgi:hypothetical protein
VKELRALTGRDELTVEEQNAVRSKKRKLDQQKTLFWRLAPPTGASFTNGGLFYQLGPLLPLLGVN